jgi:hypothetical protein
MNRKNKYHAIRTEYRGEIYDSKAEARYAAQLDLQRKAIDLRYRVIAVERQPLFLLQERPNKITYRADFEVTYADDHVEIVDVKGVLTPVFKLKQKIFKKKYPFIELRLIKSK